jgi:hypothetical protein
MDTALVQKSQAIHYHLEIESKPARMVWPVYPCHNHWTRPSRSRLKEPYEDKICPHSAPAREIERQFVAAAQQLFSACAAVRYLSAVAPTGHACALIWFRLGKTGSSQLSISNGGNLGHAFDRSVSTVNFYSGSAISNQRIVLA